MDFIYSIMAKTSVTNTSTWGVPSGKLPIVLLPSVLGDTRRSHWLPGHLPRMLFCCILSLHASANWMTSLRVGPQTVHRQSSGGLAGNFLSSRMQAQMHIVTQVMVRCNHIALVCGLG